VDRVRVQHPGAGPVSVPPAAGGVACGRAWPNPARDVLRLPLSLVRAGEADWALLDVQGRRVATLWSGPLEAGPGELVAAVPGSLAPGLYFARLRAGGFAFRAQRVAIVR
jgi:hypothetical protein